MAPEGKSKARAEAGLCATCVHSRVIENARRSRFYLCRLSETDERYRRYPQLPVVECSGYEAASEADREHR